MQCSSETPRSAPLAAVLVAAAVLAGLGLSAAMSLGSTGIVLPCMFPQAAASSCSAAVALAGGRRRTVAPCALLGCLVGSAVAMVLWDVQKVPMLLQTCAFASQVQLGDQAAGVWVSYLFGLRFGWLGEIGAEQVLAASAGLSLAWASVSQEVFHLVRDRAGFAPALSCACFLPLLTYADASLAYRMLEAPWAVAAVGVLLLACAAAMRRVLDRKPAARDLR